MLLFNTTINFQTTDDEQRSPQANRLADLARKVGILPKGSAAL